jgi:NAD(P)-dependent dehydrogenase (short-subunit alcohol dehydrogenase family)
MNNSTGDGAVVTGAPSGIGEATARALIANGQSVALLARRGRAHPGARRQLGEGALAIKADVTDQASLVAAAERVQSALASNASSPNAPPRSSG